MSDSPVNDHEYETIDLTLDEEDDVVAAEVTTIEMPETDGSQPKESPEEEEEDSIKMDPEDAAASGGHKRKLEAPDEGKEKDEGDSDEKKPKVQQEIE